MGRFQNETKLLLKCLLKCGTSVIVRSRLYYASILLSQHGRKVWYPQQRRHRHHLKPEQHARLSQYLRENPAMEAVYRFKQKLCYLL